MVRNLLSILTFLMFSKIHALPDNYQILTKSEMPNFYFQKDDQIRPQDIYYNLINYREKPVIIYFWDFETSQSLNDLKNLNQFTYSFFEKIYVIPICVGKFSPGTLKNYFMLKNLNCLEPFTNAGYTRPHVDSYPTAFFLNKRGEVIGQVIGVTDWQGGEMRGLVSRLVNEKNEQPVPPWWQSIIKILKSYFFFSSANAITYKTITKTNKNKSKMDNIQKTQVLIIGSGPAGYSAAIYAARANLKPLLISGHEPGGQLTITTDVENYPGFADTIQGPWLMSQMKAQVEKVGTQLISDHVVKVNLQQKPFEIKTEKGATILADTLIIATGAQAKWLNIPSETYFRGYGVSGCATCDGFFYKGKVVGVVGGGNTAVEEALFLTNFASKVYLFHRRDQLRAEKMLQKRLLDHPKIEVIWNVAVDEVLGNENPKDVIAVRLKNIKSGALQDITLSGLFIAIGHSPTTALFKDQLKMDDEGYLIVKPGTTDTAIPGVYAAGDVADKVYRQAITAAGLGCIAALDAERYLAQRNLAEKK